MLCASCIVLRASVLGFQVSGFGLRVAGFGLRIVDQRSRFRVSAFVFLVSCFGFRVPGSQHLASGFMSSISGFGFQISGVGGFHMKRESNQNVSGSDVYYKNSLILLVENMLCSKLLCQKGFNVIPFSYQITGRGEGRAAQERVISLFPDLSLLLSSLEVSDTPIYEP